MSQQSSSYSKWEQISKLSGCLAALVMLFTTVALSTSAQTVSHVSNPFDGAIGYLNPDYTTEVNTAIATETSGSTIAEQMNTVANTSTAVWMDHIGAIYGGTYNSNRIGLDGHIQAALKQQTASGTGKPIVMELVIYDLPQRDCAALGSNGELSIAGGDTPIGYTTPLTGTGIQEYESAYITPIYNILAKYKSNSNIRFVLVVEDDSLPNILTNTGKSFTLANCVAANGGDSYPTFSTSGVYYQGIAYAINTFHQLPNVYNYLDVGHHGWLGWTDNMAVAVSFFSSFAQNALTDKYASIDGFITNTANYGAVKEPYLTWDEMTPGATAGNATEEVFSGKFFQWNPEIDEEDYAYDFWTALTSSVSAGYTDPRGVAHTPGGGFPTTLGFLIDTSRDGWGSTNRPTGPSTSTVQDTFVDESKIDLRDDMGQWCNQEEEGIGPLPAANPGGFANLQAYVWIKPPGESDGNYPGSIYNGVTATNGDANCDPAHDNKLANSQPTHAIPNSPYAGTFWLTEFDMLVGNSYPVLPTSQPGVPSFYLTTTGTVSAIQGTTATTAVSIGVIENYNTAVALTLSGTLPKGVTAAFTPSSLTGAGSSSLAFVIPAATVPGSYALTVTATSGSIVKTASLTLTIAYSPQLLFSVTPATVSLPYGSNPTATVTATFEGGLTGTVSFSATNLPTGVQANFAPSSLNAPGGTSSVNFNAQTTTTAKCYTIDIVGTVGTYTVSAPVQLAVGGASCGTGNGAVLTSPTPSSTLTGSTASFVWTAGTGATAYKLILGTKAGGSDVYNSYTITATKANVTGIPTTGATLYATLYTQIAGTWSSNAYTYTEAKTATKSVLTSPTPSSTLTGSTATFVWTNTGATAYKLTLGTTAGASNVYNSYSTTATKANVSGIPTTKGGTLYATLWTEIGSTWSSNAYTYTTGPAVPTFTIAASPSTCTIAQGGSCKVTITVTDVDGFTGSVALAATGLPTGVTASLSGGTLTLTAASTAAAGTSTVTITGTSGTITQTTTITLTVTAKTAACTVTYATSQQSSSAFGATIGITNNSTTAWTSWTLTWTFANGQTVSSMWNGVESQSGANVTVASESYNGSVAAGGSVTSVGFNGTWNGTTNAIPTAFSINGSACTVN